MKLVFKTSIHINKGGVKDSGGTPWQKNKMTNRQTIVHKTTLKNKDLATRIPPNTCGV